MPRKLDIALFATLSGKTRLADGSISEESKAIGYDVLGLAFGEYARIYMAGPVEKPHWVVLRWTNDDQMLAPLDMRYESPQEAVDALERYVNTHPKFSAS
jgi:hypothetical protein